MRGNRSHLHVGGQAQTGFPAEASAGAGDWAEHEQHFRRAFREARYYSSGRGWPDYAPAYRYGYDSFGRYRGRRFDEVEAELERDWIASRAESRLAWAEARGAVRDIWQRIDQDIHGEREPAAGRHQ